MPKSPSNSGQGHLASFTSEDEARQNKQLALITGVGCCLWAKAAFEQVDLSQASSPRSYSSFQGCGGDLGCSGGRGGEREGRWDRKSSAGNRAVHEGFPLN